MKKINTTSLAFFVSLFTITIVHAQTVDPSFFNSMQWRNIGPFRGGRTEGAAGVAQQPNVFYIGVNNGGVWKTTDYGRTWFPVFDKESTGSIGCVVVAPSDPNIIYAGSGEGLHRPDLSTGKGVFRSDDAGNTWTHLGLEDGQQIPKIAVDPKDPNRIFVAVLGHPYGPNKERGIYRSLDGGKHFEKVFFIDENTGGDDVAIDPSNSNTVYATLWEAREGPWENAAWAGTHGGIFKSTDGGTTWKKLSKGLPENLVQAHIAIAASSPQTLYTAIATTAPNTYGGGSGVGIYRSDDGGDSWRKVTEDGRPAARIGGGDVPEIAVDPKNAEIVYSTSIVCWRSSDGGKTWTGIRGAPGGDDYQNIWINPLHPEIFLVTGDQGAIITVNNGETFSSWYNQPTAQVYHVNTDNDFPYHIYSGQQESGSVGISSRGNDGAINFRDWHPVGAEEYGYVAADPLNPNIIYGDKVTKYNKLTGQTQNVSPEVLRGGKYRYVRTEPLLFSPVDNKTLYFAGNVLFKTTDGGDHWQVISPDLTRTNYDIPSSVGTYTTDEMKTMQRRGVIYAVAPSYKDINTIWCGTDDGLIQLTKDGGKTWNNVTPTDITSWSKISIIDASHFDVNTAYVAVNRIRCDDMHPYIYKTHDGGKTWTKIVNGLPDDPINVVREDSQRKGLLFAGSETTVYVSFDDGEHWQSLRLNMPASSIRDLVIKNDDIVVGTHGRGFWILDNITSLRQISDKLMKQSAILYKPQTAYRVRWSTNTDTPIPQEEPAGQNPPDGAIIDYYLKENAKEVTLDIMDAKGKLVRRYSSNDKPYEIPAVNIPLYWIRPEQLLSAEAGSHRFLWDMHYTPLDQPPSFPMTAVYKNTPPATSSPWVMPGVYTAKLTVDGQSWTQTFTVKMDPRVKTSVAGLQQQHDMSLQCYEGRIECTEILNEIKAYRAKLQSSLTNASADVAKKLSPLEKEAAALENAQRGSNEPSFGRLSGSFAGLFGLLQESDTAPTSQAVQTFNDLKKQFDELKKKWAELKSKQ
jgi:photosystem II stability/assembly factor-like uncharacterized protein